MIDKINKVPSVGKISPTKMATKSEEFLKKDIQFDSLTMSQKVMSLLNKEAYSSTGVLRQQMIYQTLVQLFGERASSEPRFMALAEQIDKALQDNSLTEERLQNIIKLNSR